MALIPKKVVGSKGFNGFNVELVGLQEVINQVGLIGKVANKAFSEAAVAIGKMLSNSMKEELAKRLADGKKETISVREVSDRAKQQIEWEGITVKEKINWKKPTPEQLNWFDQWKADKIKSGKEIRGKPKRMPKNLAISSFITKDKAGVYGKTGSLMKSITYKKWSPPAKKTLVSAPGGKFKAKYVSSGVVFLYVGSKQVVTSAYNQMAREMQKVDTRRYYHLVEFGHKKVVMGRRYPGRVPAHSFMQAAYKRTGPAAARVARGIVQRHLAKATLDVQIRKPAGRAA